MPRPKLTGPVYRLRLRGRYWTLSWTDAESGRTVAVSTGQTEEHKAQIWRDQYIAGLGQPEPPPQPLISQILDGYIDARTPHVQSADTLKLSAATIKYLVGNLQPQILGSKTFAERRRTEQIPGAPARNTNRPGRPRQSVISDGTIRREGGVLRAALAWAVREKWIDKAPYVELPSRPPPRERWLTREELAALISEAAPHVRRFIILAYHTAARAGAILDLTWDRVDLEHKRIDYRRPGRATTNKRRATVPLNQVAFAELREARRIELQEAQKAGETPPLHVIEFRGRPLKSIKKGFAEACRRAGVADCSPHVLRHTAATHMVMAKVPLAEIARMLGDSEAMVEKVYGKHSPDYLRAAADALAGDLRPRIVSETMSEK